MKMLYIRHKTESGNLKNLELTVAFWELSYI